MFYKEMYSLPFYGVRTVLGKERMSFKIYKETSNNKRKGFQDQVECRMLLNSTINWNMIKQ